MDDYKAQFKWITEGYEPKDIFNFDGSSLFFKLLPNHSLCLEAKTSGVKKLKKIVFLWVCVLLYWRKLDSLVTGHSAPTRCFKGLDLVKVGIVYKSSKKKGLDGIYTLLKSIWMS